MRLGSAMVVFSLICLPRLTLAGTETWTRVFAAERDTVVFFATDGTLLRAPFNLATRETLWLPRGGQHLVRVRVNPDGTQVAWLTRGSDDDTTRLWIHDGRGTVLRMRYAAFQAKRHGYQHSEPDIPSVEDPGARGARLVQANILMRRFPSNTLEWSADGRNVVLGYDGGIAKIPVASVGSGVTQLGAIGLEALRPSPLFLVDAIGLGGSAESASLSQFDLEHLHVNPGLQVKGGRKVDARRNSFIFRPVGDQWRLCPAPDLGNSRLRAASPTTLWWATDHTVRAVHVDSCESIEEFRTPSRILWMGFDERRRALLWAWGQELWQKKEEGGAGSRVLDAGSAIRSAFDSRTGQPVALVTKDSLILWDASDESVRSYGLGGMEPCVLFEGREGRCVVGVNCGAGRPRRLAHADSATRRLVEIETPRVRGGVFHAVGEGRWILLYDPAPKPPRTIHAYDVRHGTWTAVRNPGISGWEPLRQQD